MENLIQSAIHNIQNVAGNLFHSNPYPSNQAHLPGPMPMQAPQMPQAPQFQAPQAPQFQMPQFNMPQAQPYQPQARGVAPAQPINLGNILQQNTQNHLNQIQQSPVASVVSPIVNDLKNTVAAPIQQIGSYMKVQSNPQLKAQLDAINKSNLPGDEKIRRGNLLLAQHGGQTPAQSASAESGATMVMTSTSPFTGQLGPVHAPDVNLAEADAKKAAQDTMETARAQPGGLQAGFAKIPVKDAKAELYDTAQVENRIKAIKPDANIAGVKKDVTTGSGFITTDGTFANVNTGHNTTLGDLGEGEKGLNDYLNAGGIRTRVSQDSGDINIEIHKAPTPQQMQVLQNLPNDRRYFYDVGDITQKGQSGTGTTKADFLKELDNKFGGIINKSGSPDEGFLSEGSVNLPPDINPRVAEQPISDLRPRVKIKPTTPVEKAVDAQLKPNPELISAAKGIGQGKVPLQPNTVNGALGEIKNLFGTGAGTTDVQNALRANRGQFDLSKDQLIRESAPLKQQWSKLTPEDHVQFIKDVQTGVPQANPQLDQLASQYRTRFDQDYQLAKELKPNLPYMENYFAQNGVWADTNAAKSFYQKFSLGGTPGALQQRQFPTIQDGINAGLKLKETNPETIALNSRIQLLKAHMAQDFQEQQLAKGVPQEKIDAVLQKYLSPGLQGSKIYQTVRQGNAALNSLQLGFSAFHVTGTAINASVSKAGMAINSLLTGHPLEAMKNIIQTPTASLEYVFKGNKIIKDVRAGNTTEDIQNIAGGGGRLRTPEIYQGVGFQTALQNMRADAWQTKLKGGLQTIPATIETAAKPIMEWWVPRLKAGAAADLISANLKRLPAGASEEEINAVRSQAINSIDNRFGQLNMDNVFWNKTLKDLLALGTRSPGWNIGTLREIGGGVKDMADLKQLFSGKGISDRSAYTLALPVVVGMLGATYQYVHTGQGPQEIKDFFYPKTGQIDPKTGNPERVSFPTYAKDVYSFMTNPMQTVANKLSPIVSIGTQLAQNKDYYGNSISDPYANQLTQAGQKAQYLATAVSPFALTGGSKRVNPSAEARVESFAGITKAPGTITNPGQQDYYNANAELQNLNSQFSTVTKKIANGDLTQQQGQAQLQDIYNRQQNAKAVVNKGLPTTGGAQGVTHATGIVSTPGGLYSYVDAKGTAHKNLTQSAAQAMQTKDTSGEKLTLTNGKSIDLTPPTKGTGIDAYTNQDWNYTKARQVYQAVQAGLYSQQLAQAAYNKLGVTQQQAQYDYNASHSTDAKTQFIMAQAQGMDHTTLLQNLIAARTESVSGKQLASNAVITNLYNNGLISKSEEYNLNKMKTSSSSSGVSGSGGAVRVGGLAMAGSGGGVTVTGSSRSGGSRKGLHPPLRPKAPRTAIMRRKRIKIAKSKRVKLRKLASGNKVQLQTKNTKSPNSLQIST